MREILFRGISEITKTFIYGDLVRYQTGTVEICVNILDAKDKKEKFAVYPETVGQFTGMVDKNGKRIFEGDIVKDHTGKYFEIRMHYGSWIMRGKKEKITIWDYLHLYLETIEVVGNIHENPKLLKEGVQND